MNIVQVSSSLERAISETAEGAIRLRITVLLHEPARRLYKPER